MSKTSELTNEIIQFLYENRVHCWRQNTTGIWNAKKGIFLPAAKKGVSDILGVISRPPHTGRFLAVEVKYGRDTLSDEQEGFLLNVTRAGGLATVAKDLPSFKVWWYDNVK